MIMQHSGQQIVTFNSGGHQLVGTMYLARGEASKPTAVLLHGLPGIEKGIDLAHGLREMGWNALVFHYRGCWGSEGDYSLLTIPADVKAALDFLQSGRIAWVDPHNLVVFGHSLGSWAALAGSARDGRVKAVALSGAFTEPAAVPLDAAYVAEFLLPGLRGIDPASFSDQWKNLEPGLFSRSLIKSIPPRPLLIIHGQDDEIVPCSNAALLQEHAGGDARLEIIPGADHDYCWHRKEVRRILLDWIKGLKLG